eukprot:349738-Chlamydomonas_euryale.AAC.4
MQRTKAAELCRPLNAVLTVGGSCYARLMLEQNHHPWKYSGREGKLGASLRTRRRTESDGACAHDVHHRSGSIQMVGGGCLVGICGGTNLGRAPLMTLVGASNELPESEELDALYDRFLIRRTVAQVRACVPVVWLVQRLKCIAFGRSME